MVDGKNESAFYALVDWGTSSFRLWLVDATGNVLAQSRSNEGMLHASEIGFEQVLETHLNHLGASADLPVMISGMAGARQGWMEAAYVALPAPLDGLTSEAIRVPHATRDIRILPGMAQISADAANVMRGEETQLAGIAKTMPTGLICMPGTHCKWVELTDAKVTGMSSFMTGEIFAVLSQHSILKHAVDASADFDAATPAFARAETKALAAPAQALAMVFSIRASQLLGFEEHSEGAAHLSGLLIGAEIGAAKDIYGAGPAGLVASERLNGLYKPVMEQAGFRVILFDGEEAVRNGLLAAARQINSGIGA